MAAPMTQVSPTPTVQIEVSMKHCKPMTLILAGLAALPSISFAGPQDQPPLMAPAAQAAAVEAQRFPSPDDGVKALLEALRDDDRGRLAALFGSSQADLLSSGDEVEDKQNREGFLALASEKWQVETLGPDKAVLHAGNTDWPFPIPLVKQGDAWQFDARQGREEILDRRIGRNELSTLGVIHAYGEAQFEYASADRDGDGVSEYAQKLRSEPGKTDGLFWEAEAGQPESPLGPLVAEARAGGYKVDGDGPVPYHGYYYRILTRQGAAAPGGKYDYVINGNMIAGFGLLAFPAQYGASGIMSFLVNHQGKIYQRDLGPKTTDLAAAIKDYNPDGSWFPVEAEK
jgi:hypothetical protein